jgi:hypothetical protein
MSSKDIALFVILHPEAFFYKNLVVKSHFIESLTDVFFSSISYMESQSLITPILLYPQVLFVVCVIFLFISFFFSFYSNSSKEDSSVDSDYLSASVTVESEKELGSFDDIILMVVNFNYMFGWYFYLYCCNIVCGESIEMLTAFLCAQLFMLIVCIIPLQMLFDFGGSFIIYLKGGSPNTTLLVEYLMDYIAAIAYFVRVIIQGIRLALMFVIYVTMHDCVIFNPYEQLNLNTRGESI